MELAEIPRWNEDARPDETRCPFELVLVFEDTTTRNRSLDLCENLTDRLRDTELKVYTWHLNDLAHAGIRERTAKVASRARMIVLSLRAAAEIPDALRRWMHLWLPSKALRKSALVALVASTRQAATIRDPLQDQLCRVAEGAGMDYFLQEFDAPDGDMAALVAGFDTDILEGRTSSHASYDASYDTDFQWGING